MKLRNVLIVVKDIEKSKKFYHDLFGLDVILDNEGNVILTEGLVDVMSLSAGAEAWADALLEKRNTPRTDRSAEIAAHGFDITTEAVKLQEFYLNAYEQNC